uniref:Uncharacterized protein n=1 Tax=Ixodes ricinus TaxID=34613 RepID=A0A6B0U2E0_IXORI
MAMTSHICKPRTSERFPFSDEAPRSAGAVCYGIVATRTLKITPEVSMYNIFIITSFARNKLKHSAVELNCNTQQRTRRISFTGTASS